MNQRVIEAKRTREPKIPEREEPRRSELTTCNYVHHWAFADSEDRMRAKYLGSAGDRASEELWEFFMLERPIIAMKKKS